MTMTNGTSINQRASERYPLSARRTGNSNRGIILMSVLILLLVTAGVVVANTFPTEAPSSVQRLYQNSGEYQPPTQAPTSVQRVLREEHERTLLMDGETTATENFQAPMSQETQAILSEDIITAKVENIYSEPRPPTLAPSADTDIPYGLEELWFDVGNGPEVSYIYTASYETNEEDNGSVCSEVDESMDSPDQTCVSDNYQQEQECLEKSSLTTFDYMIQNEEDRCDAVEPRTLANPSEERMCKFFNLCDRSLHLIMKYGDEAEDLELLKKLKPVTAMGTTCSTNHTFILLDVKHPEEPVATFYITSTSGSLYAYDDGSIATLHQQLNQSKEQQEQYPGLKNNQERMLDRYQMYQETLAYAKVYEQHTGIPFLAHYGRAPPRHFQWIAEYVGQKHVVRNSRNNKEVATLTAVSTSPNAFEIQGFLTRDEVKAIRQMALTQDMEKSRTIYDIDTTRTSYTAWIQPTSSTYQNQEHPVLQKVIDNVYRKAANLLRIPYDTFLNVTEPMQIVRYREGQEYMAHYDFGVPPISHPNQPARFATVLFYLNGGEEDETDPDFFLVKGGETAFPRAKPCPVKVTPKAGKAALFYSMLPDGNMDQDSLHAALPAIKGTKWLANLWVWDPLLDFKSHL